MLRFLDHVRTCDGESLALNCAVVLVKHLVDELISGGIIPRRAVLLSSDSLVGNGCSIYSMITAEKYASKIFDLEHLPRSSHITSFLNWLTHTIDQRQGCTAHTCIYSLN